MNFPSITIEPGKTVKKPRNFPAGALKVKAQRNGKIFSAECQIYIELTKARMQKSSVTGDWSRDDAATFDLVPGTYDLTVINREDARPASGELHGHND